MNTRRGETCSEFGKKTRSKLKLVITMALLKNVIGGIYVFYDAILEKG